MLAQLAKKAVSCGLRPRSKELEVQPIYDIIATCLGGTGFQCYFSNVFSNSSSWHLRKGEKAFVKFWAKEGYPKTRVKVGWKTVREWLDGTGNISDL